MMTTPRTALGQASEAVTLARDLQDRIRSLESANFDLRKQVRDLHRRVAALDLANSALRKSAQDEREDKPRQSMIGNIGSFDE